MQPILTQAISGISQLIETYEAFVLDQWGVIHDGNAPYDGVLEVLANLRKAHKRVVILTNSSKSSRVNEKRLVHSFGIDHNLYDCLVSSAEVTLDWLQLHGREFFGTPLLRVFVVADGTDATIVDESSLTRIKNVDEADCILLLSVDPHQEVDYNSHWIKAACARSIPLVCCSADQLTVTAEGVYTGLRAIVAKYQRTGGQVLNFGKPARYVYELCQSTLIGVPRDKVLAIGDQLESDISGAKGFGFDAGLVRTGATERQFPSSISMDQILEEMERRAQRGLLVPNWLLPGLVW